MEVRILGPVEVERDGAAVALEAAKQRALVTVLALYAGHPVSLDVLVAALWGEEPPRTAAKTLQGDVSSLRRLLGAEQIVTTPTGYRLDVSREQVDVLHAEDLIRAAQECRRDDPQRACELAAAALDLWRGEPLVDLADSPLRSGHAARLEELRYAARAGRIDADLALGRHREVIPELRQLVADLPLREHLWADLILALYRADRQAEALAAYQELRCTLVDELGVEPSTTVQELECRILLHDPGLALTPPPPPHNLPAPVSSFVGRDVEVSRVQEALGGHRLVTLLGPGGVGKSRLAIEVATTLLTDTPDGAWWVDLASVGPGADLLDEMAGTLGVSPPMGVGLEAALVAHVRRRRLLVVLDNCEHVVASAAGLATWLLEAGSMVRVLTTSRVPLGLPGEQQWLVEPLRVPEPDDPELGSCDAVRLFRDRAAERSVHLRAAGELRDVAEICRAVDGLPLAIELTAARCARLGAAALRAEIADRDRLLHLPGPEIDRRHHSLQVTFDASYRLLDATPRRVFARLAVFPGDFGLAAGRAVACPELPDDAAADVLGVLVDSSLLAGLSDCSGEPRYRLLELLRAYAGTHLDREGAREDAQRRHAAHYRDLAVEGRDVEGTDASRFLTVLRREDHNVRVALDWYLARDETTDALALAGAVGRAWFVWGRLPAGRALLEDVLARSPGAPPELRARAWLRLAWPVALGGDVPGGLRACDEARAAFEAAGDPVGVGRALRDQAHVIVLGIGDTDAALPLYREAIRLLEDAGDPYQRAWAQIELAQALILADRYEPTSGAMLDEAEIVFEDRGDEVGLAHLYMDRMLAAVSLDDLDTWERMAVAELGHSRAAHDVTYEQISLVALGVLARRRGELDRSHLLLRRAADLAWESGNVIQLGIALQGVAASTAEDAPRRAARLWGAALAQGPSWPMFLRRYSETLAPVRRDLGEEFDRQVEAGRGMSAEESLALAYEVLAVRVPAF
ncbi:MAG: winged helix-turn-helix domain-containing protein [Acidimicrobiales bacterium]|nr:winged helix-turn-helix domain-containing protein [Acidimicrobiales bacterium]